MSKARWGGFVVALGALSVVAPAIPAAAQGTPVATVTGISPSSGPAEGETKVTVRGTEFVPDATRAHLVLEGGAWQQPVPASAVTVDTEGLTASFTMPVGPPQGGRVGVIMFTPAGRANGTPVFTYTVPPPPPPPTVSAVTPTGGPAGTVVTVHGTGLQPTGARVVVQNPQPFWQRVVPASEITFSSTGTELSFAVPDGAPKGARVGLIVFTSSGRADNVVLFGYAPDTAPRARVAEDGVASSPSSGSSSPVVFVVVLGAIVVAWGLFVAAMHRRTTRAS
jgi:hypothetical protein